MIGRLAIAALCLVGAGCLDLAHNERLDARAYDDLVRRPPPFASPADVAIVLGCPAVESGEPSLCQRCRVKAAVRAWRAGEAHALLFTGGAAHNRWVEASVMADLARAHGVPDASIAVEPHALTTWMNLRFSSRIMAARGWRTALVVSTQAHLVRADRFARWFGIPSRYVACDLEPRETPEEMHPR